ncbi:unnamed protein product [Amoebophrya sp. A120]|nr:unnamed protein product [Amoebophrya sp. A120]|eukprot:GSA120T00000321001.1
MTLSCRKMFFVLPPRLYLAICAYNWNWWSATTHTLPGTTPFVAALDVGDQSKNDKSFGYLRRLLKRLEPAHKDSGADFCGQVCSSTSEVIQHDDVLEEDADGKKSKSPLSLLQTASGLSSTSTSTKKLRTSSLQRQKRACGCPRSETNTRSATKSEILVADQCTVTEKDQLLLGVRKTAFISQGVLLDTTKAYVSSCAECERHSLACAGTNVEINDGQCLCVWHGGGEKKQMLQLPCNSCVPQCIGRVRIFESTKPYEPDYVEGMCVQKKDLEMP